MPSKAPGLYCSSLPAQSLPCNHRYSTKRSAPRCEYPFLCWLFDNSSDRLNLRGHGGCSTSNCSFGHGFSQTFATYITEKLPTTPKKANTCSCGAAMFAGYVEHVESWLDQERLSHKRGSMSTHSWRRKDCVYVWFHWSVPSCITLYGLNRMVGIDL